MDAILIPTAASRSVHAASQVHRDLLSAFMARVEARLEATSDTFTSESLKDLLITLGEQRDGYLVPVREAVAA